MPHREFRPNYYGPKLQEMLRITGVDPNSDTGFDDVMAIGLALNGALWKVYDEINTAPDHIATTAELDQAIETRQGLKSVVNEHIRTTLEKIDLVGNEVDINTMVLQRQKPQYERVKDLLEGK